MICPKPRIPLSDRLCHSCGKPGHISSLCPTRKASVKAVDEQQPGAEPDPFFGCVTAGAPYRKPSSKPRPSARTMATVARFKPTSVSNRFASLATVWAGTSDQDVAAATRRPHIAGSG